MPDPAKKSLAFNLGAFWGHVWKGVRTDVKDGGGAAGAGDSGGNSGDIGRVIRTTTETREADSPMGKVLVRRTTIEEVELADAAGRPAGDRPPSGPNPPNPGGV